MNMSLILRKHCQQHLDNVGLTMFHTEINHAKQLSIVGDCGKPLVNISGISFSRTSP